MVIFLRGGVFMERFPRINHDVNIMGGKACIKGLRVTVSMILEQLSGGKSVDKLLEEYPYLSHEDVMAALEYGAWAVNVKNVKKRRGRTVNIVDRFE